MIKLIAINVGSHLGQRLHPLIIGAWLTLCFMPLGCVYPVPSFYQLRLGDLPNRVAHAVQGDCRDREIVESVVEQQFQGKPVSYRAIIYSKTSHHRRQVLYEVATGKLQ